MDTTPWTYSTRESNRIVICQKYVSYSIYHSRRLALAFCDYDELQRVRKKILATHTFPRYLSSGWKKLDQVKSKLSHCTVIIW